MADGEVKYFSFDGGKFFVMKKNTEKLEIGGYKQFKVCSHRPVNPDKYYIPIIADRLDRDVWRRANFFLLHPQDVGERFFFSHEDLEAKDEGLQWEKRAGVNDVVGQKRSVMILGILNEDIIEEKIE